MTNKRVVEIVKLMVARKDQNSNEFVAGLSQEIGEKEATEFLRMSVLDLLRLSMADIIEIADATKG